MITIEKIAKMEESLNMIEHAKQKFGLTKNPFKAGWLLHDGSMLDFSNKRQSKYLEHVEIGRDINLSNFNVGMDKFRHKTGAIRMNASPRGGLSVQFGHKIPTERQWQAISNIHANIGGSLQFDDDRTSTRGIVANVNHLRAKLGVGTSV